jgi:hypothetical protein
MNPPDEVFLKRAAERQVVGCAPSAASPINTGTRRRLGAPLEVPDEEAATPRYHLKKRREFGRQEGVQRLTSRSAIVLCVRHPT